MKLGVFGGTFDPPHLAHLVIAQEAIHQLGLDRLLLIPAAVPPHKRGQAITDGGLRLEMLRAATAGMDRVEVSDLELRREGPSYTVATLRALRSAYPDADLFLLLGADQVRELDTWREPEAVRNLATLLVLDREGRDAAPPDRPGEDAEPPGRGGDLIEVRIPRLDISSTDIRRRVAAGAPIRFLVPDPVIAIVERERLYR